MDSISRPDDVAPISYTELAPSGVPARWIVLVHGGGVSKECYLETPDGRQGWAARLVSLGYGVLVVDWLGLSYEAAQHVDDRAASARLDYESVCRGMGVFLSGLGRNVVLVVHSMAGPIGFRLLETHGDLIDGLVAVAPGPPGNVQAVPEIVRESDQEVSIRGAAIDWTIPKMGFWEPTSAFVNDKAIGPSRRFPRECIEVFRRTLRPIPARMLYQRQNIGGSQMRIGPTDAFTNKPILVFTGGADTDHPSQLDQDIVAWLTDQGAAVTFWSSELPVLAGNGHMLMVEDNSDELADEIARWITAL
jgi:pimeloyl-ACP methyl ester carboxylesterase